MDWAQMKTAETIGVGSRVNSPMLTEHSQCDSNKEVDSQEAEGQMAYQCGMFLNKLKRGIVNHTSSHGSNTASEEGPQQGKDSHAAIICKSSDWSQFEGVLESDFFNAGGEGKACKFLREVALVLMQYYVAEMDRKTKVVDFHHPHQLREMMSHCLDIDETPRDLEQLLSDCKETLKYCVKTGGRSVHLMEIVGAFDLLGENCWENEGEGIFAPGGAVSNLYGVLIARHSVFPKAKEEGMPWGVCPVVFTSEHSHFSIKRACALLGIGTNNCIRVRCDHRGKMLVEELEQHILAAKAAGKTPVMVNAMCGTTGLGAIDPLDAIADVCRTYGIWMHVDGAWGGALLMSRDHRYLMKGIERADSMTWNPHKMMGVPLQCSAILCKRKGILQAANQMKADYLFQQDKHYDLSWDTGDKTIQCGRHNDIFKMWLMWRAKALMMESGTTMVQYQPLGTMPNFFRVAVSNPILTTQDMDFLVDEIDRLGRDIPYPILDA
ncbi:hypothetical protein C0Q70_04184 [Pomacea canaliculata]|uniref:Glutamate decarboxylase n=1 Tax=Pomacea canaliculata TaxID=400727 RepID=A0A2T7PUV0_POMCA|nr:hypothetical protein C0Q70_04184 [Pomacea canaliculata]